MPFTRKTTLSVLALLALLCFGLMLFSHNKADVDLWGNLGFVSSPAWSDAYLRINTFSFTEPDHEWINHEWLAEYILNATYRVGGNALLILLKTILGFALTALLYDTLRRTCSSAAIRYLFLLLVMSTIGYGFSTRPHLFTYVMLVLMLFTMRFKPALLPVIAVPAGVLWVNLHGAFFIGIIVLLAYTVGQALQMKAEPAQARRNLVFAAAALLLFTLSSLLNPYGASTWSFVAASAAKTRTYLSEWAPFNPMRDFSDHSDFIGLTIVCVGSTIAARNRSITWILIGALALTAGLVMRRNIPLFALVSVFAFAPYVDVQFGRRLDNILKQIPYALQAIVLCALIGASLITIADRNKRNPLQIEVDASEFPVGSMRYIHEHGLKGNILAFFDWAEYCIWELHPDSRVFLDGRYKSAYSSKTIDTFFAFIYSEPGWESALTEYPTSMVLIHRNNPAYSNMTARAGWTLVCTDTVSGLFLKDADFAATLPLLGTIPHSIITEEMVPFQ